MTRETKIPGFVVSVGRAGLGVSGLEARCLVSSGGWNGCGARRDRRADAGAQARRTSLRRPVVRMSAAAELDVAMENLEDSAVQLSVTVPSDQTQMYYDKYVSQLVRKASIPGFRKGKAPLKVAVNHFGADRVKVSACEELISQVSQEAIKSQSITTVGQATLGDSNTIDDILGAYTPGQPLSFTIKMDVWPEAKLKGDYKTIAVEVEDVPMDESLLDQAMAELQKRESTSVIAPEGAKLTMNENTGVVDMAGFKRNEDGTRGEAMEDIAEGSNVSVKMEAGAYFPGFVEGLEGMAVGETRDVNVDFPDNTPRPQLRGLKAIFEVKVNAIQNTVLPDLDDAFAQSISEVNTIDELREEIRGRLETETEDQAEKKLIRAVEDKLVELIDVELPNTLLEEQTKTRFAAMMSDFQEKGASEEQIKSMITKESFAKYRETSRANVVKQLKGSFAFTAVAKAEGIEVEQSEIDEQLDLMRIEAKGTEIDEDRAKEHIEVTLQKQKVVAMLKEHITITKVAPPEE